MMTPRNPIEVARLIASGRWKPNHIDSFRSQFGDRAMFDALLCPFLKDCTTESLTHYECQEHAGTLLLKMMLECELPLKQTIRQSLPLWNLSVEQWPFYLCRRFGTDAVSNAIDEIAKTEILDEIECRAVDTLRYWLRAKPELILASLLP